ncbi:MAG: hypothetical protein AABW99_04240 [archaeon]
MPAKRKKSVSRQKRPKSARKSSFSGVSLDVSIGNHHSMLREALKDVARELSQLREEKSELESTLDSVASDITSTQNKEVNFKEQLHKLSSVETALSVKRQRIRKKLEQVKEKMGKVRALSSKMESL